MSTLTILSDAELDAVSGGNPSNFLNAGAGGSGGTVLIGSENGASGPTATSTSIGLVSVGANGGHGGNVVIRVRFPR